MTQASLKNADDADNTAANTADDLDNTKPKTEEPETIKEEPETIKEEPETTKKESEVAKKALLDELTVNGVKHNADDIMHLGKDSSGKIIFLEKGTSKAGYNHVLNHTDDFVKNGIARDDIGIFVFDAAKKDNIVGYQGKGTGRPIFETFYKGQSKGEAVTIGNNGFIVAANPVSIK